MLFGKKINKKRPLCDARPPRNWGECTKIGGRSLLLFTGGLKPTHEKRFIIVGNKKLLKRIFRTHLNNMLHMLPALGRFILLCLHYHAGGS